MEETQEKKNNYGKRPLWQWIALYIVVAVIAYGLVYYFVLAKKGGSVYNQSAQYQQPVSSAPVSSPLSPAPAVIEQISITGSDFAFKPSQITIKKGQPVAINFVNAGAYPHNLTISGLNIKTKTIQSGEQDTIQFTPNKTGPFTFICTVPGHADKGMKGVLIVQ
jgi:plastocyanin